MKKLSLLLALCLAFATVKAQTAFEDVVVNGTTRQMLVLKPKSLPAGRPLIISCHGMNQDASYQHDQCAFEAIVDTAQFYVAFPQGEGRAWDIGGTKDINFIKVIIDEMAKRYQIDRNRVYLSGFSMGGMFTYHAMNYIADKIAAFAPMSGYVGETPNASRPIPIIHIHGDADDVVTINGVQGTLDRWIAFNGCNTTAKVTKPYPASKPNSGSTQYLWTGGKNGVEVAYIKNAGKGHWVSNDPAYAMSSQEIWNFCKRFSLDPGRPSVNFVSPGSETYTCLDTIQVKADATDTDGTIIEILLYVDGKVVAKAAPDAAKGFVEYEWARPTEGNHTLKAVCTDNEGKTQEAVYDIVINAPKPIVLLSANPVNESFDLPVKFDTFNYKFNLKVDCSKVKAVLSGAENDIELLLKEVGEVDSLTFSVPEGTELPEGQYRLIISNLVDERGVTNAPVRLTYTFGITEVLPGQTFVPATQLSTKDWISLQSTVQEGIPTGWKRVNSKSDASDIKESGAVDTGGCRLKYFEAGGDFDAGFYFSARDYEVATFTYGLYPSNRLHLTPGAYTLSLRSIYWNEGAQTGNTTFDLALSKLNSTTKILSDNGISSSGQLNEISAQKVSGSALHEYTINIEEEGDYTLQFTTRGGWTGLVLGDISIYTAISTAQLHKAPFVNAVDACEKIMAETEKDGYVVPTAALRLEVSNVLATYENFQAYTAADYDAATRKINAAYTNLQKRFDLLSRYYALYETADSLVQLYADDAFMLNETTYKRLKSSATTYTPTRINLTKEAQLQAAITSLTSKLADFQPIATSVQSVEAGNSAIVTEIYGLDGQRRSVLGQGVNIVRERSANGETTRKVLR